jgi:tetratricopeptide (TPR) repeat protein
MPREPKHPSQGGRPAAERPFVDREEFIAPVHSALKEPQRTKPLVLVYHGGAGIGKSRLRRELTKQMAADPGVVTATLDFAIPIYRQPETALLALRNSICETYKVMFPSFDLAYAVHWQKTHEDTPVGLPPLSEGLARLSAEENRACAHSRSQNGGCTQPKTVTPPSEELRPLLECGSLLPQLLDESGKLPLIGLIPKISALVDSRQDTVDREWWTRGERELEDLPQMEPGEIVGRLPKLWAADLRDCLRQGSRESGVGSSGISNDSPLSTLDSRRAVLFIDTYEGLWETGTTEAGFFKRDEWVRELVKQLPEVLWVICGRQKLRWEEVEKDWSDALSQHELAALPEKSARGFLASCGITNEPIQDAIVKGSQGVPHYLDLAVDTVERTKDKGQGTKLTGDSPDELVKQFVRHLEQPEIETLQVLSGPRFWYYGLFENLMAEYQTGYPASAYDDLARFSFVKDGAAPGTQTMHELMRDALQEAQSPELRKRVHLSLHELYAKELEGLDVKGITEKHRTALTEAFYHGRHAMSAAQLWAWFDPVAEVFREARQGRAPVPLLREIVQALEAELGPNHADVATALWRLARQLEFLAEWAEAEPLLRRALVIAGTGQGSEHPHHWEFVVALGHVLSGLGRFNEAEPLYRRAAKALEGEPGKDAEVRLAALDNLAIVLAHQSKYAEAEELSRQILATRENELGPEHDLTAHALNTLCYLLAEQGRHSESEPLKRRALATSEKRWGGESPQYLSISGQLGVGPRQSRPP